MSKEILIKNPTPSTNKPSLGSFINQVFIIAYKENTDLLEKTIRDQGFQCEILRQPPLNETNNNYSPSYLCLLNHKGAWQRIININKPCLIIEADFVPVINMNKLPLPFPTTEKKLGINWLYTCAPQVYSVSSDMYAQGFSTSMVAYIISPQGAKYLLDLAEEIKNEYGAENYSSWDGEVDNYLRNQGLKNYIPFRCYGEHGGKPNLEHKNNGLSLKHRADRLYGKLAFMPDYTSNMKYPFLTLIQERFYGRSKGTARLFLGRFARLPVLKKSSVPFRIMWFCVSKYVLF